MKLCLQFCWSIENQESSANTSELEHITEVNLAKMIIRFHVLIELPFTPLAYVSSFDFSHGKFS